MGMGEFLEMIPNLPRPERIYDWNAKIFTKSNVFPPYVCDEIIKFALSEHSGLHRGVRKHNLWDSAFDTCQVELDTEIHILLQPIWKEIIKFYNFDIDFVEQYEIKRYGPGDFFDPHTDNTYGMTVNTERKISMSIQLNQSNEYEGGDLDVMSIVSSRDRGSMTVFPSFFRHEVTPVTSGYRWVLIGWAWGPYWR